MLSSQSTPDRAESENERCSMPTWDRPERSHGDGGPQIMVVRRVLRTSWLTRMCLLGTCHHDARGWGWDRLGRHRRVHNGGTVVLAFLMLFLVFERPSSNFDTANSAISFRELPQRRCDDGSYLIYPDGSINWDCELDGCNPLEPVCWDERLDFCFDDAGNDTGDCVWRARTECSTLWGCIKLYASCDGRFDYDLSTGRGSCTPIPRLRSAGQLRSTVSRRVNPLIHARERDRSPGPASLSKPKTPDSLGGWG